MFFKGFSNFGTKLHLVYVFSTYQAFSFLLFTNKIDSQLQLAFWTQLFLKESLVKTSDHVGLIQHSSIN